MTSEVAEAQHHSFLETKTGIEEANDLQINTALSHSKGKNVESSASTKMNTATGRQFSSLDQVQNAASVSIEHIKYVFLCVFTGLQLYVNTVVNLYTVAYFSYRSPDVSKDLIKTAYHLLKVSYENNLLNIEEIYNITNNNIVAPMARQNRQNYKMENTRSSQLKTMRTSTTSKRGQN